MKSISVLFMSFMLTVFLSSQVLAVEPSTITSDCSDQLCVINTTTPESVSLSLYNKAASVMTIDFSYEVINFDVSYELTNTFSIASNESIVVLEMAIANENEDWNYRWGYSFQSGDFEASHDGGFIYMLPYQAGDTYRVSQGFNGSFSHVDGVNQYGVDFVMAEGTSILAARAGKVVKVVEYFNVGGATVAFVDTANYIVIEQSDGTHANYAHLQQGGALVKEGDLVEVGQKIGLSGNTGFSTGPHLHFSITAPIDGKEGTSHPFIFESTDGNVTDPIKDTFYTSTSELFVSIQDNVEEEKEEEVEEVEEVEETEEETVVEAVVETEVDSSSSSGAGSMHWLLLILLSLSLTPSRRSN